jgi:mRNA-degrading endonuclease HigB of HigAB toxin-antitoxin module
LIHVPSVVSTVVPGWESFQQKNVNIEHDYFDELNNIEDLKIITHNFNRYHFDNQAHEVHKSDFLRWKLLNKYGGLWSDIDILYTKSMWALPENCQENSEIDTALCPLSHARKHTVGFLLSSKKNNFFQSISKQARKQYTPTLYQCMGSDLINSRFKTFESLQKRFPNNNFIFLNKNCVYSITSNEIDLFYQEVDHNIQKKLNSKSTIGYHWFAGHPVSQEFENKFDKNNLDNYNNILSTAIKKLEEAQ